MKRVAEHWWTLYAFIRNAHAEWSNRRLENKKRAWTAHKMDGGGIVPLGKLNQSKAIDKVARFGSVRFVDTEVGVIMYAERQ